MMRIHEVRIGNRMSQKELAEKMNVRQSTVSQWESGQRAPAARMLPALAAALGCSIDELFREPEQTAGEG